MNPSLQLLFQKTLVFIHHYLENESFRQYMLSGGLFEGEYLGNYVSVPAYLGLPQYIISQFNPTEIFNLFKNFAADPASYRKLQQAAYIDYELTEGDYDKLRGMESIPHGRADVISSMIHSFQQTKAQKNPKLLALEKEYYDKTFQEFQQKWADSPGGKEKLAALGEYAVASRQVPLQAQEELKRRSKLTLEQRYNEWEQKQLARAQGGGSQLGSYKEFVKEEFNKGWAKEESFRTGTPPPPPEAPYWKEYRKQMGEELGAEEKWEKKWQEKYKLSRLQKLNESKKKGIKLASTAQSIWSFNPLKWLGQKIWNLMGNLARLVGSKIWGFLSNFLPKGLLNFLPKIGSFLGKIFQPLQILWNIINLDFIGLALNVASTYLLNALWGYIIKPLLQFTIQGIGYLSSLVINIGGQLLRTLLFSVVPRLATGLLTVLSGIGVTISAGAVAAVVAAVSVLAGLYFLLSYLAAQNPPLPPGLPTPGGSGILAGAGCPSQERINQNKQSPETCQYLNPSIPLFTKEISQEQTEKYIRDYKNVFINAGIGDESEFRRRTNYIIQKSKEAGLNPAIFLAYWKSESEFSTWKNASDMGCAPGSPDMQGFEKQVECALGLIPGGARASMCARSTIEPITKKQEAAVAAFKAACDELKAIRNSTTIHPGYDISNAEIYKNYPINYPIQTFDDFVEAYGSSSPLLLSTQEKQAGKKNNNCVHTYSTLLEVTNNIRACIPIPDPLADKCVIPGLGIPSIDQAGLRASTTAQCIAAQLIDIQDKQGLINRGIKCTDTGEPGSSFHCWVDMATYEFDGDPNYFQCTEFVWTAYNKAGYAKEIAPFVKANAGNWPILAKQYPDIYKEFDNANDLQIGDMIALAGSNIVTSSNSHIAIVISRKGNVIKVAQANTSAPTESWVINEATGQIDALKDAHPNTRVYNRGFIRIIGRSNQ